jgi:YD repeat-containing protein
MNNNATNYVYDAVGRISAITDSEGQMIEYVYNHLGLTSELTTYGGGNQRATTRYYYDLAGNLIKESSPL